MCIARSMMRLVALGVVVLSAAFAGDAAAQQVECSSPIRNVTAVTRPAGHVITTRYQLDSPNLQPLLSTTIVSGDGCLVAHLSGQVRITDNYVAFQVRVDGVPLEPPAVLEPAVLAAVGLHGLTARPPHHNPPLQPAVAPPGHDHARHSGEDEYPSDDLEVEE